MLLCLALGVTSCIAQTSKAAEPAGVPAVTTRATTDAKDSEVAGRYFPADHLCRKALRELKRETALRECAAEFTIAQQFPDEKNRHLEIIEAYQLQGRAFGLDQRPAEAEPYFAKSVLLARKYLRPSDAEFAYTLFYLGGARQTLGQVKEAMADYLEGEQALRLALQEVPSLRKSYTATLVAMQRKHAALLRTQHNVADAEKLENEANALAATAPSQQAENR